MPTGGLRRFEAGAEGRCCERGPQGLRACVNIETAGPSTLPLISCRNPGFDDLHAAIFKESRTRGGRQQREVGNPGPFRSG